MSKSSTSKKRTSKQYLAYLYSCISHPAALIGSFALLLVGNSMTSVAPMIAGRVADYLATVVQMEEPVLDMQYFLLMLGALALLYIFGNLSALISNRITMNLSREVSLTLRERMQRKLQEVPLSYLDTRPAGDVMSCVTSDIVMVESLTQTTLVTLFVQVTLMALILVMMLVQQALLTVIYLVVVTLSVVLMRFVTARTRKRFKAAQDLAGEQNSYIDDIISNNALVKAYNHEGVAYDHFSKLNQRMLVEYQKSRFLTGLIIPLNVVLNNVGYIVLALVGGIMIVQNHIDIGVFLAFLLYGQMLNTPLSGISTSMNNIQQGFSSLDRVLDLIEAPEMEKEEPTKIMDLSQVSGAISFDKVVFGYTPDRILMHDVNFTVNPGEVCAIVGPSGAGKTTLINLLLRFYDLNSGRILLDGRDITEYSRTDLRRAFGMVLQESIIFSGTIAENIAFGKLSATREEIESVAHAVGCDTFIEALPQGYDTFISEGNMPLSQGEQQLLVLARTLISNPKILILDEATSQMDTRTEVLVTEAMERAMRGRTSFIIAHRLFTIRNADKIIYMQDGDIKEVGSHAELMTRRGYYYELYQDL